MPNPKRCRKNHRFLLLRPILLFLLWGLIGIFPIRAEGEATDGATTQSETQEKKKAVFDVRSSTRYRTDSDDYGHDHDLYQYLSLHVYDMMDGHLDFYSHGAFDIDLNETDGSDNAYDEAWPRLNESYLDFHDYGPLSHLRIGRQFLYDVDDLHFDGLYSSFLEDEQLGFFIFGGRPVSYYSSNSNEWLAGGGVQWRPWDSR